MPCAAADAIGAAGTVRLNSLAGLSHPEASKLKHNFRICLVVTKQREKKTAEIPALELTKSV
jgi:hypothetical protein